MNANIFRAYDIRGRYPEEFNEAATEAIAAVLPGLLSDMRRKPIVLGHDARISSPAIYKTLQAFFKRARIRVIDGGIMTTPMLYFLVHHYRAAGGVMVTASHNPKYDNGLKIVAARAIPVSGEMIKKALNKSI